VCVASRSSPGRPRIFFFEGIQFRDAFLSFGRDLRFVCGAQVIRLSPHMHPAGRFPNSPGSVHLIESRLNIGLKRACEISEVRSRLPRHCCPCRKRLFAEASFLLHREFAAGKTSGSQYQCIFNLLQVPDEFGAVCRKPEVSHLESRIDDTQSRK
jgi:hypothetical protein